MNILPKIKRMNRGFILAAIALLAVSVSIIVDWTRFKNERDNIVENVEGYMNAIEKALAFPEDVVNGTKEWAKDDYAAYEESVMDVFDEYWTEKEIASYVDYFPGMASMSEDIGDMVDNLYSEKGYYKSLELTPGDMKVKTYGPGGAKVTVKVNGKAEFKSTCDMFMGVGMNYGGYVVEEYYEEGELYEEDTIVKAEEEGNIAETKYEFDVEVSIILLRQNGEWKISGMDSYIE